MLSTTGVSVIAKRLWIVSLGAVSACSVVPQSAVPPQAVTSQASTTIRLGNISSGRDGEAEAIASLRRGEPPRLFAHEVNAEYPSYNTPGLLNCDPAEDGARDLFRPLPEADWSEGNYYTEEQLRRAEAARSFAKAYNLAIFRERRSVILKVCPRAQIG